MRSGEIDVDGPNTHTACTDTASAETASTTTDRRQTHCCLCGLLCPLPLALPVHCYKRNLWLAHSSTRGALPQPAFDVQKILALVDSSKRLLIWLDGADVNTARAAVELTRAARATLHIGQSTGAQAVQRVLKSTGWIGTSLAEVATTADLIITLGDGILSEAPLIAQRFFQSSQINGRAQWCHISTAAPQLLPIQPTWTQHWPRDDWYRRLTQLKLSISQESCFDAAADAADVLRLAHSLTLARYAVWIWDSDEFCNDIDELCIRRLVGIASGLSASARCSLLALDSHVARVTAEETLLWLTGCSSTATFDGTYWSTPEHAGHWSLDDWQREYDTILLIRSLPSVSPLTSLSAAHYIVPIGSDLPPSIDSASTDSVGIDPAMVTRVARVGVDSPGYLMRGDRATTLLCDSQPSAELESTVKRLTAECVLDSLRTRLEKRSA